MDQEKAIWGKYGLLTHRVRVKGETRELDVIYRLEYDHEKGKHIAKSSILTARGPGEPCIT